MSVSVRIATAADIPFIMETERGRGYEDFVGRWEKERHEAEFTNPASAYLIGERDGVPNGFALLRDLDEPFGNVLLKRIAVREPGTGFGKAFLRFVMEEAFRRESSHRLWLDVFVHNERARHVYRSVGFREDGVLREAYRKPDGERVSQMLMSILRPEWAGLGSLPIKR